MNTRISLKTKKYLSSTMRALTLFALVVNAVAFPMTAVQAQTPINITFFTAWNGFVTGYWPLDIPIQLSVDDLDPAISPDFTDTVYVGENPDEPDSTRLIYDFPEDVIIQPGYTITLDNGTVSKSLVISSIQITDVDVVNDIISGVVEPFANITVIAENSGAERHVAADENGNWVVDFKVLGNDGGNTEMLHDIIPGDHFRAMVGDDDGDITFAEWHVPYPPSFGVEVGNLNPTIHSAGFLPNSTLTATVDNPETPEYPDYTTTATTNPDGWAIFSLYYDVQPGDTVTLTDGVTTKSVSVKYIIVTSVNAETDTISGMADPFAKVQVWSPDSGNMLPYMLVTSDANGNWTANYSGIYDLTPGVKGFAETGFEDDNNTMMHWKIPNPTFGVRANTDQIEGWEWTPETTVQVMAGTCSTSTTSDEWGNIYLELWEVCDIQPGDTVTVNDGNNTKEHVITSLTVDTIDPDADTISGTADDGSLIYIGFSCEDCPGRNEIADGSGNWVADYSEPGDEDWEDNTFDIQPGQNGEARQCDEDGDCTQFEWHLPNPTFGVRANTDQVEGWEWTPGTTVMITVDDPGTPEEPDITRTADVYEAPWNPGEHRFDLDLRGEFDIQPGFLVTVTGGTMTKEHTVLDLVFTEIDTDNDVVHGIGVPDSPVNIWTCDNFGCPANREEFTDGAGNWSVDFSVPGDQDWEQDTADLGPGSWIDSSQSDEDGDSTIFGVHMPNPRMIVFPEYKSVETWEWSEGVTVNVSVDGKPQCTTASVMGYPEWDSSTTYAWIDFPGGCDVTAGDLVTVTDGETVRTHEVQNLTITEINAESDFIAGLADPGAMVYVWPHGYGEYELRLTADGGAWLADFAAVGYDVQSGTDGGRAEVRDENGSSTAVDWHVPNPTFGVRANDDRIEGWQWPEGVSLTITIDDPSTPENPDVTKTTTAWFPDWDPSQTWFELDIWDVIDIQPGFFVTVTDGTAIKEHTVLNLEFTDIDIDADIVHGIGQSDSPVNIWTCDNFGCPANREEFTDGTGNWSVDFSIPGDRDWEQETADLGPGSWIDSEQFDEDGDRTMFGMDISSYTLHVVPAHPEVHGHGRPWGTEVTLIIDNDTDPNNGTLYEETKSTEDDPWCGEPCFDLYDVFDLQVGQYVTMTDGNISKTVLVSVLTITEVDFENDVLRGIADPGSRVAVNIWSQDGLARYVTTKPDGTWEADFSFFGNEDFEQFTTDIVLGDWGRAIQLNPDGTDDGTLEYWWVPFNHPPTDVVITAPVDPLPITEFATVHVDFADPDGNDDHTVLINWGDGTITNITVTGLSAMADHQYQSAGVYTIEATVTDSFGEMATATYQYVVIYDPEGGFVTGGGWIDSPEGAYTSDPSLTGKATFGFVSKYKKGATLPTGNTEFQFKVADLNFKSTSYDWLVIAGPKAQFKGVGTINGMGEYKFMLSAIDGSPDKFRIKIWDAETGVVIYDNMLDADETADPSTVIQGGSIVIHKAK